jgi:hypothetical protein
MTPSQICNTILGLDKVNAVLGELSSPQIKAILKEGGVKAKLPGGYVSRQKRLKVWAARITSAVEAENDELCAELLQQWLLHHRRPMLMALLDRLEVKHQAGETDDSFLISRPTERVREAAEALLADHDRVEAAAYLHYIAYQQKSSVFEGWEVLSPGDTG